MRRILTLFFIACVAAANAGIPFTGPGVNTHGQLLPVDKLRAIGIRWVRGDLPVKDVSEQSVKEFLGHYRGMPVLWILSQHSRNAPDMAKRLVRWGVTDIEVSNEPDLAAFNLERRPWSGTEYGRWFGAIRRAVGPNVRLYGPVLSGYSATFIDDAIRAGMSTVAIDVHGYNIGNLPAFVDSVANRWKLPVIVSEIGVESRDANPANHFLAWKRAMGDRPWCWYDGPKTDWRGLFDQDSGSNRWSRPTNVYRSIVAGLGS
jgi:hypothetical protein